VAAVVPIAIKYEDTATNPTGKLTGSVAIAVPTPATINPILRTFLKKGGVVALILLIILILLMI
jgi:hypothetical protein